jgi:hypothetical protein
MALLERGHCYRGERTAARSDLCLVCVRCCQKPPDYFGMYCKWCYDNIRLINRAYDKRSGREGMGQEVI